MTSLLDKLTDTEILGFTIIGEARGEPIEGQVAVGSVIRNRVLSSSINIPVSYKSICLKPKQFSCWNLNDKNRNYLLDLINKYKREASYFSDPYLRQCMFVAEGISEWDIVSNIGPFVNYMTNDLWTSPKRPSYARGIKDFKVIGNHTFFTAKKAK